jgi:hypothetical protein
MVRLTLMIVAPALLALGSLEAQAPLTPGAHIRVVPATGPAPAVEGTLVAASGDSVLVLRDDPRGDVALSLASVDHVDLRVAPPRSGLVFEGAGAGLLVGVAGGALVGPVFTSACTSAAADINAEGSCASHLAFDNGARLRGAIAFGIGGAILGAVIGGIAGRARWRRVSVGVADRVGSPLSARATIRF